MNPRIFVALALALTCNLSFSATLEGCVVRVAEDPGVYSVPNKCRVYLRTGSDRKSLFVFVWLRDRDPGRTAGIGGRDCVDSVGSRAAVSEGVEKGCGDLRHLCGLLLSAPDLRGETDGEAGGAFAAGIAGIHVCGT